MRRIAGILAITLLIGGVALAVDDPDNLMSGTVTVIKFGKLAKFVGKPSTITPLPSDANAPNNAGGGSLQIFDTGKAGNEDTYSLPQAGWSRIPAKTTKALKGYKYKGAGSSSDPCKNVIVKATVVKAVCKGSAVQLTTPFTGNVGIVLTVGPDSKRYCASFGPGGKNDTKQVNRKGAPTPSACPVPFLPTTTTVAPTPTTTSLASTTSTSSTSSTSTSSTSIPVPSTTSTSATSTTSTSETSTTSTSSTTNTDPTTPTTSTTSTTIGGALCCNDAGFIRVTTKDQPGDCGDLLDSMGVQITNIACSGLYTGGGGNSVPLPFAVPDQGRAVSAITSCEGNLASLGGTTSSETGSNRNCTSTGCLFGAPLAVPNSGSTPTSVCVLNAASAPVSGTVQCDTGASSVTLPLSSTIFLTGDTSTDPSATIDGIQPCPLCSGGNPGTCVGGPNNGMACLPETTDLGGDPAYPTSHDCPPDPMFSIGSLPIAFSLTSGTVTWSGSNATNDTGSTVAAGHNRTFSGFCRDLDGTGAFEGSTPATAHECWRNGVAVGAACSGTFESCVQRNNGAFGPSGSANRTIIAIGSGTSILGGPADGHLVSIFSIPPTYDPTVDAAGDLPGPGAVALPATAELCTNAMCE
ncbi:MAG: hypothetical protein ACREF4_08025 [Gammaproteobacteria bacterium]